MYKGIHARKELGALRHQPVRPRPAGPPPGRHRRLQPVRQAVRGRRAVAAKTAGSTTSRRSCTGRSRQAPQAYDVLLDYWLAQNPQGRHIWPGLFTSRIGAADQVVRAGGSRCSRSSVTRARPRRDRPRPLQHGRADGKPPGHRRPAQGRCTTRRRRWCRPRRGWATRRRARRRCSAKRGAGGVRLKLAAGKANAQYAIWSRHGNEWRSRWRPAPEPTGRCGRCAPTRWWSARSTGWATKATRVRSAAGCDRLGN